MNYGSRKWLTSKNEVLLHPAMVDFSRPVYVRCGDRTAEVDFRIDEDELLASMVDTLDLDLAYAACIPFNALGGDD